MMLAAMAMPEADCRMPAEVLTPVCMPQVSCSPPSVRREPFPSPLVGLLGMTLFSVLRL